MQFDVPQCISKYIKGLQKETLTEGKGKVPLHDYDNADDDDNNNNNLINYI